MGLTHALNHWVTSPAQFSFLCERCVLGGDQTQSFLYLTLEPPHKHDFWMLPVVPEFLGYQIDTVAGGHHYPKETS